MTLFNFDCSLSLVLSVLWAYSQQLWMPDPGTEVHRFLLLTYTWHTTTTLFTVVIQIIPKGTCNKQLMEKAMATHSSTLAWKIPWTEEPGGLQSMGSVRVGHDWATSLSLFTFMHWRRKWQPTPVFLPGESQGRGSLVACIYGVAQCRTQLNQLNNSNKQLKREAIQRLHKQPSALTEVKSPFSHSTQYTGVHRSVYKMYTVYKVKQKIETG